MSVAGRPRGSFNKGFVYALGRAARELQMKAKERIFDSEELSVAALSFQKLFSKALRVTSPDDIQTMAKLAPGLAALTKAFCAIEKHKIARKGEPVQKVYPID